MMAALRTAVSLIGFGFAIVQFFERLRQVPEARPVYAPNAAFLLGLALIASGVLTLVIAIRQFRNSLKYFWSGSYRQIAGIKAEGMQSPLVALAILLTCIGIFAFVAVLLHLP